jgi:hypothetical protein
MTIDRIIFEKELVRFSKVIPKHFIEDGWQLRGYEEAVMGDFIFALQNFMAYGIKDKTQWQEFPATWFDHLKCHLNLRYGWKLKVRMSKIATIVHIKNYCPHFGKETGRHVEFMQSKPFNVRDINGWDGLNERFK